MRDAARYDTSRADAGFTLVELMVVVLVIGILVAIAIPVFSSAKARAEKKTCFANQRTIVGMTHVWLTDSGGSLATLAGPVDASHALTHYFIMRPPHCPAAPDPVDFDHPTLAEGIYTLNATGDVIGCTFGSPAHGVFY